MANLEGHVKANPFDQKSLDGITDPKEFDQAFHRSIRENLQKGGLLPPTEGLTRPALTDGNDTGSFFKDVTNKVTNYAGVKAFDNNTDKYEERRFKFITAEEGYRDTSYKDSLGRSTIGYGFNLDDPGNRNTAMNVLKLTPTQFEDIRTGKQAISQRDARVLFESAVGSAEKVINQRIGDVPLRANQRLALVSMAYNHPNLIGPKITKALKEGNIDGVLSEIRTNSNKYQIGGIQSRREREARLFTGYSKDEGSVDLAGMFGIKSAQAATDKQPPLTTAQALATNSNSTQAALLDGWAKAYAQNPPMPDPEALQMGTAVGAVPKANKMAPTIGGDVVKRSDGSVVEAGSDSMFGSHVRMLINDLMANKKIRNGEMDVQQWKDTTYDASFFRQQELQALYQIIGRSYMKNGGRTSGSVNYTNKKGNDYEKGIQDVKWSSNSVNADGSDTEHVIKTTLGQFNWKVDKKGDLIVQDMYDFNDAKKLRTQYDTDFKRAGHLASLVADFAQGDIGAYGIIRRYAAFYGSQEGEGASFKINLGKVDMKRLVADTKATDKKRASSGG